MKVHRRLQPIGQRLVKSVIAVLLCFAVYELRGRQGIPFYSALAVLQCMQQYSKSAKTMAKNRVIGTMVGSFWGLVLLLLDGRLLGGLVFADTALYVAIAVFTGLTIYTTVVLDIKNNSYFSCVVFLSITINHIGDANPFLFVWNRILDTLIGVALSLAVNHIHLPRRKRRDVLFVSGVDDTLINKEETLSPYSKVELNRLIEEGLVFTLSTNRTPATVRELFPDLHLPCPIIAMDGAVLYDMKRDCYVRRQLMAREDAQRLHAFMEEEGLEGFANTLLDDTLLIFYRRLANPAMEGVYEAHRHSPYRNYIRKEEHVCENVLYLLYHEKTKRLKAVYERLLLQPWQSNLRIVFLESAHYPGYSFLKIYDRGASREEMLAVLKERLGREKTVTFGSIPGKYDVFVENPGKNTMVKQLKKLFEPYVWSKKDGGDV